MYSVGRNTSMWVISDKVLSKSLRQLLNNLRVILPSYVMVFFGCKRHLKYFFCSYGMKIWAVSVVTVYVPWNARKKISAMMIHYIIIFNWRLMVSLSNQTTASHQYLRRTLRCSLCTLYLLYNAAMLTVGRFIKGTVAWDGFLA